VIEPSSASVIFEMGRVAAPAITRVLAPSIVDIFTMFYNVLILILDDFAFSGN